MRARMLAGWTGRCRRRSLLLAAGVAVLVGAVGALGASIATNGDMSAARAAYPAIVGTRLDSCRLCHPAGSWRLDPYGRDYDEAGRDFGAIEGRDSDGDRFDNLAEIVALTFPGDPGDHPDVTVTSQPTATATEVVEPTATGTEPPTAAPTIASPTVEPPSSPTVVGTAAHGTCEVYLPLVGPRLALRMAASVTEGAAGP